VYFFFFFPVGTDSKPGYPPIGTALLVATILALFSLRHLSPDLYWALVEVSFRPSAPSLDGAFLSLLLHGGWGHLLGNGLYLYIFGRQLESRHGLLSLVLIFFAGGIASNYVQSFFTPETSGNYTLPVIGASGSVAALLGATILRFSHQRVRVLYLLFAFLGGMTRGGVIHVNTVPACLFWFVFQVVQVLVAREGGGGSIAYSAHAGGFLAGIVLGIALRLPQEAKREVHRERGRRYFEKANWYAAAGELTTHLDICPHDREARAMRARCAIILGRGGEAATDYLTVFREAKQAGDLDEVAHLYREMHRYGIGSNMSQPGLFKLAFRFRRAGHSAPAADVFQEIATRFSADPKSELALIRRAEILWEDLGQYEEAQETYGFYLESFPDSQWRDLAEARLGAMRALTGETILKAGRPDSASEPKRTTGPIPPPDTSTSRELPSSRRRSASRPRSGRSPR
jgi:membrane associated rhomboid family serine protease